LIPTTRSALQHGVLWISDQPVWESWIWESWMSIPPSQY